MVRRRGVDRYLMVIFCASRPDSLVPATAKAPHRWVAEEIFLFAGNITLVS
eukprot:CAMPEP_0195600670 /NCGR_PEP_ID=MMETSP0815-20121206/4676_1 /TAXON_ID=97485 /ORGANISM="Prymnesium parvum, Strain Texoma1" /LENGTH=50 /DNA_ID=CAMNT_0040740161 /DNA_START=870 /DNA_END=1022 /DNA_ORIENTATION=+